MSYGQHIVISTAIAIAMNFLKIFKSKQGFDPVYLFFSIAVRALKLSGYFAIFNFQFGSDQLDVQ